MEELERLFKMCASKLYGTLVIFLIISVIKLTSSAENTGKCVLCDCYTVVSHNFNVYTFDMQ